MYDVVHLTYRETEKGHGMAEFSSGSVLFASYGDARTRASGTSSDLYYSSNSDLTAVLFTKWPLGLRAEGLAISVTQDRAAVVMPDKSVLCLRRIGGLWFLDVMSRREDLEVASGMIGAFRDQLQRIVEGIQDGSINEMNKDDILAFKRNPPSPS
jgi:hypothetical protein